jgi:hypothetical protein
MIRQFATGNANNPRPERLPASQSMQLQIRLEEYLLQYVLDVRLRWRTPSQVPADNRPVSMNQRTKRILIAL